MRKKIAYVAGSIGVFLLFISSLSFGNPISSGKVLTGGIREYFPSVDVVYVQQYRYTNIVNLENVPWTLRNLTAKEYSKAVKIFDKKAMEICKKYGAKGIVDHFSFSVTPFNFNLRNMVRYRSVRFVGVGDIVCIKK